MVRLGSKFGRYLLAIKHWWLSPCFMSYCFGPMKSQAAAYLTLGSWK